MSFKKHCKNKDRGDPYRCIKLAQFQDVTLKDYFIAITLEKLSARDRKTIDRELKRDQKDEDYDDMELEKPKRTRIPPKSIELSNSFLQAWENRRKRRIQEYSQLKSEHETLESPANEVLIKRKMSAVHYPSCKGRHPTDKDYDVLVCNQKSGSVRLVDEDTGEVVFVALFKHHTQMYCLRKNESLICVEFTIRLSKLANKLKVSFMERRVELQC